ncbi:MAG: polyisoprenoid-binding protein [Chitinophagia bacterium]|nr:polyisoprenoid-binding protein [Chitinophagia bacterium]
MATTIWALDPAHSELQFKVRHLMITNVTGSFNKFAANIETEGSDVSTAKISFTADVDSISTNNEQRDGHLKSADFFDAGNHPQITFSASGMQQKDAENYQLTGDLSIRGVAHPVTLNVEFGGIANDSWGNTRAGFTIEGKLHRKDFGLTWNAPTETGGVVVSDEVKIHGNLQFIEQKTA